MEMAGQREDFSDEEIDAFGTHCDDCFELWVDLTGLEGMTNYIHMIGSGHMTYYLQEWRNLYRCSQHFCGLLLSMAKRAVVMVSLMSDDRNSVVRIDS